MSDENQSSIAHDKEVKFNFNGAPIIVKVRLEELTIEIAGKTVDLTTDQLGTFIDGLYWIHDSMK